MRCEKVREYLDDYQYGDLDSGLTAALAEHLQGCEECRRELELLERETRMYDAYAAKTESTLSISPDLWQRALAQAAAETATAGKRMSASARTSFFATLLPAPWMRQAVAAVLLIGLSVAGTLSVVNYFRNDAGIGRQAVSVPSNAMTLDAALQSIQKAEQQYLNAIQDLNNIMEKKKSTLDPRIVAELQASLNMIDEHIAVARKAYYAHPDDTELALHMLAAYSRKVEILQDLTAS